MEPMDPVIEMLHIAEGIRRTGEAFDDSPYTGVAWDGAAERLVVYRVPGDEEYDRDVLSRASAVVVVGLADAPRTFHENERIMHAVMDSHDLPIRVHAVATRDHWSIVEVHAEGDLRAAQRLLDARYGSGVVVVEPGTLHVKL